MKKKISRSSRKRQILSIFGLLAAIILMPTTIIMIFGMIPTIIALLFDKPGKKVKSLTVGALNLAGCTPFLLNLWDTGHNIDNAIIIVTNPLVIVVMWGAAGFGYMIDSALSGIVGTIVAGRARVRITDIQEYRKDLIERWGEEVTGEHALDAHGFSVEKKNDKES